MRYPVTAHVTSEQHDTLVTLSGLDEVPVDRLRIDTTTPRFARTVNIETSDDGTTWTTQSSQSVSRIAPGDDDASIPFEEVQQYYWRVRIRNGDDSALADVRIEAYGAPRHMLFDAKVHATYWIVYGNPYADPATYDYGATHPFAVNANALPSILGPVMQNQLFVSAAPATPWSEQHRWILWAILILAVVVVGVLAIKTMPSTSS